MNKVPLVYIAEHFSICVHIFEHSDHFLHRYWTFYPLSTHELYAVCACKAEHCTIFVYIDKQSTICVHIVEHCAIYAHIAEHFTTCVHIAEHSVMCACIVEHSTIFVHIVHPNRLTNSHIWRNMTQKAWMGTPLPNSYKNFKCQTTPFNKQLKNVNEYSGFLLAENTHTCRHRQKKLSAKNYKICSVCRVRHLGWTAKILCFPVQAWNVINNNC